MPNHSGTTAQFVRSRCSIRYGVFTYVEHLGDITLIDGRNITPVDIICFGSPCQAFSAAGHKKGLADPRSGLFLEAIRIINEMREQTNGSYPKYILWENVRGILSMRSEFKTVLEAFAQAPVPIPKSGKWANAGMVRSDRVDVAWCIKNAQHFGVAQRRRRIFLAVDFAGQCASEILFKPKSMSWYNQTFGKTWESATASFEGSVRDASETVGINGDIAGTLDANYYKGSGSRSGIERDVVLHPKIFGTLTASGSGTSRPGGMGSEVDMYVVRGEIEPKAFTFQSFGQYAESENSKTILACDDFSNTDLIAYCLQGSMVGRSDKNGPQGSGINEDVSFTLNTVDRHVVSRGQSVRRLTPWECELLMGFPVGYTEFGHDGKTISDTSRYKMLGNSVVVSCVAYFMETIAELLQEEKI